jgi:flagellar biogenesis protein FliO
MRALRAAMAGAAIALALVAGPALAVEIGSPSPAPTPSAVGSRAPRAAPTVAPAPSATPFTAGQGNDVQILPYLLQLLVVTGIVGGIGYVTLQYIQKKMPGLAIGQATGKQLRLVEKLTIDPKRMVFMVNVGNRYWLMASTDTHVTTVAELSKDDLGGQFAQLLEQEKSRGESPQ